MMKTNNNNFDIRDKLIASLEQENKLQDELIKQQKIMIMTLEKQVLELKKLLNKF